MGKLIKVNKILKHYCYLCIRNKTLKVRIKDTICTKYIEKKRGCD